MIRSFHRRTLAALAAGASLLALGDAALAQGKYKEAPALADQVKAGKLPAVDARLPETPLVVPTVEKVGEYGGTWRRAFLGPADANNYVRVVYDALFRFSPDGAKIEPKVAESADALGRLQDLDDQAAQGFQVVRRPALQAPTTSCSGTTTCCSTRS